MATTVSDVMIGETTVVIVTIVTTGERGEFVKATDQNQALVVPVHHCTPARISR